MEAQIRRLIADLKNFQLDLQFVPLTSHLEQILALAHTLELELRSLPPVKDDDTEVLMKTMLSQ